MDRDRDLEALSLRLSQIGPFDSRDPAEAAEAVGAALAAWDSLLRESPELISELILRESGRQMVHGEIGKMMACLTRIAQEIVRNRLG